MNLAKRLAGVIFCAIALLAFPSRAQYDDVSNLPDAPTRIPDQQFVRCNLEGVQVSRKEWENGVKNISVAFILTRKPSVYFHYYDANKKAVVFDFYDTRIGDSPLDSISEAPITGSSVEFFSIDLNKKIAGLKPDFRDVVRVSIFVNHPMRYDVQEDEGLITMSFKSDGNAVEAPSKPERSIPLWELYVAAALAGVAGFGIYELLLK